MSERRKELITEGNAKKQAISVILVAILLFGLYLGSTALFGFLFGTRTTPSDELTNAPKEKVELFEIAFDMFDLMDLLNYEDLLEHADEAVFYIEDYDYFDESWLWKFSVMYEYNNDGSWSQSISGVSPTGFTSWDDYDNDYSDRDMIRIKYPIDAIAGENSLVIPTLFPTPHIMDRPWLNPGEYWFDPQSSILYKDLFNVASINLNFDSEYSGNLTYDLFEESVLSPDELNESALIEIPAPIKHQYDQYLQIPGDLNFYLQNNPNFKSHYDVLDAIIDYADNTYVKANKIRNYLQENFEVDFFHSRPATGEDVVEWFCGTQSGIFSDFAAAFTVFARAFGIASRYVDGFNSRYTEESYNQWEGKNYYTIKRLNLYSWSEIYVPLAIDGSGVWTEMDILFEGQNPLTFEEMEIIVYTNTTSPVIRGDSIKITANLSLGGIPQEGKVITFWDITQNRELGKNITNNQGSCSRTININSSTVVGPHLIRASSGFNINYTIYSLYAPIVVTLDNIIPNYIDKSLTNYTKIMGDLIDPANGNSISDAEVEYTLLDSTNNKVFSAFDPNFDHTDDIGEFNTTVKIHDNIPSGNYSVRVDFNGSFHVEDSFSGFFYDIFFPLVNDSSSTLPIEIVNPEAIFLDLYINGYPHDDYFNPTINRPSTLQLKAELYTESTKLSNELIYFYDVTEGLPGNPLFINSTLTNSSGIATIPYYLGSNKIAGPHLIYAEWESIITNSYFILDDNVNIILNPPQPIPNVINRSGSIGYSFNIKGSIVDNVSSNPIKHAIITVKLLKNNVDNSSYLQPIPSSPNQFYCGVNGFFDLNFEVLDNTPIGNFSIRVDFNGTFDYSWHPIDPITFNLAYINTSTSTDMDLKIEDPEDILIEFWINGTKTNSEYNDGNPPWTTNRNEDVNFTVKISRYGTPITSGYILLYDVLEDNSNYIGNKPVDGNGVVEFIFKMNESWVAGSHKIRVKHTDYNTQNYTYIILNESVKVEILTSKDCAIRNIDSITVSGSIKDIINDLKVKQVEVTIKIFNKTMGDYTNYFYGIGSMIVSEVNNWNYEFMIQPKLSIPFGEYFLRVDFNGTISDYPDPFCSIYLTNYMSPNSSVLKPLNISAGTVIIDGYYDSDYEDGFVEGETITIYGKLTWDNGTAMEGYNVNMTLEDSLGYVFAEITNTTLAGGEFWGYILIQSGWDPADRVFATYHGDNFILEFRIRLPWV